MTRVGMPDMFDEADEVHISVAFSWDIPEATRLELAWRKVAPTYVGGPATGMPGGDFEPGKYIREGYVITSRGCPNHCWFCSVPGREGDLRELPIRDGWNVLDDNLLACSDDHIKNVFRMLARQKHPIEFTGGLEAERLKEWHCEALRVLHPKQLFFAYDTPDDREPLHIAARLLLRAGFTVASHALRCFVLIGYPKDTFDLAEKRLSDVTEEGFTPMAMLYRGKSGETERAWRQFQRQWARPAMIHGVE
jgi:hypothetical protein